MTVYLTGTRPASDRTCRFSPGRGTDYNAYDLGKILRACAGIASDARPFASGGAAAIEIPEGTVQFDGRTAADDVATEAKRRAIREGWTNVSTWIL